MFIQVKTNVLPTSISDGFWLFIWNVVKQTQTLLQLCRGKKSLEVRHHGFTGHSLGKSEIDLFEEEGYDDSADDGDIKDGEDIYSADNQDETVMTSTRTAECDELILYI